MKLNEAMRLLEDAHIDYMSVRLRDTGDYTVVLSFATYHNPAGESCVGYGVSPTSAFDDAISKIHTEDI